MMTMSMMNREVNKMEKVRLCEACGKALILDKEHHKVVRNVTVTGLAVGFGKNQEPQYWDAFDCEYCGCQTVIGERKREVCEVKFEEVEEDTTEDEEPQDGQISSPEDDDTKDILKKIEEAGE